MIPIMLAKLFFNYFFQNYHKNKFLFQFKPSKTYKAKYFTVLAVLADEQ